MPEGDSFTGSKTRSDDNGEGRLWKRIRALIWRRNNEPTLREQLEEKISEHEEDVEEGVEAEEDGDLSAPEREMLRNLLHFSENRVDDVMVPRNQIESINLDLPIEEITAQLSTAHHRRVVAYQDQFDNVVGTLRVRHALTLIQRDELTPESLRDMIREAHFVPSATPLLAQIQNFQEHANGVSLVVDEYGEIMGLVTLEDILEEIIGEFNY
jgi:Mg2+/Co2+ transporter CorB